MSLVFPGSTVNDHYKIESSTESIAAAEDEWFISMMLRLNTSATTGCAFQILEFTDSGRIRILYDASLDQLQFHFAGYGINFGSIEANYADEWIQIVFQRRANGDFAAGLNRVGAANSGNVTWYDSPAAVTHQPTGNDHWIGVGHSGTVNNYPFDGDIAEVCFAAGSGIPEMDYDVISDWCQQQAHVLDFVPDANLIYFFNFETANATETDLVNSVDATKSGTGITAGSNPSRATYGHTEMYPRLASPPGYHMDGTTDTDLSTDAWQLGFMFYIDSSITTGYTNIFSTRNGIANGDGGFDILYDHSGNVLTCIIYSDNGFSTRTFGSTDWSDKWAFACIERSDATTFELKYMSVDDSDTLSTSSITWPDLGSFAGADWTFMNNGALRRPNDTDSCEYWLVEGDTVTDVELASIANGTDYITDIVADANIRFYQPFSHRNASEFDYVNATEAVRMGTIASFTHPITAAPDPPIPADFDGAISAITGAFTGTYNFSGTLSGSFSGLTGLINASSLGVAGVLTGTLIPIIGDMDATVESEGVFTGSFEAPIVVMLGKSSYPIVINGEMPELLGSATAYVLQAGTFVAELPQFDGKLLVTVTDENITETIFVSSNISLATIVFRLVEAVASTSTQSNIVSYGTSLIESLIAFQRLVGGYVVGITDDTSLATSQVTVQQPVGFSEGVVLGTALSILSQFTVALGEGIDALSVLTNTQYEFNSDAVTLAETYDITSQLVATVTEVADLTKTVLVNIATNVEVIEVADLATTLSTAYLEAVIEVVALTKLLSLRFDRSASLQEVVNLGISLTAIKGMSEFMAEVLGVAVQEDLTLAYEVAVSELMKMEFVITLADEDYTALVFNTETEAPFFYSNFPFNSFHGNLAATSDGIYILEGDTDDGTEIDAYFETGYMDFGVSQMKRFQPGGVYIGFANDGSAVVKVSTSNNGVVEEDWYEEDVTYTAFDTERLKVHDGVKSRYWKFKVLNKEGSHLDLDTLQLFPIVLKRRLR